MSTITKEQQQKIADWLATHELPVGLGNAEAACSIAAINLSLTGELTDHIPDCMSSVIGRWIVRTQDTLPTKIRNSAEWKRLLPFAAGTGRGHEKERHVLVLEWMWTIVLPELQGVANTCGFGTEWAAMLVSKDRASALVAKCAANAAAAYAAYAAANAANANAAVRAAAAYAAAYAADAAYAAYAANANAAADAARAAAYAADAYAADANAADANAASRLQFWQKVDPCALLAKLIAVSEGV